MLFAMPVYIEIPVTILVLAVVAFAFGFLLAVASKKFAVKKDPRIAQIMEHLAGANCGGCGYSGCMAYATAVVEEGVSPSLCPVAGVKATEKIAAIMGVEVKQPKRMRAQVMCAGTHTTANYKYLYHGLADCHSVARLGNGPKECSYGCIGLGSCINACAFNAIRMEDGAAYVEYDQCRACGMCVQACPQHLIELVPFDSRFWVSCKSQDRGPVVRNHCQVGCIGCGLCVKACPVQAISLDGPMAKIDYSRCTQCGLCAAKCPRKIIYDGYDKNIPAGPDSDPSEESQ